MTDATEYLNPHQIRVLLMEAVEALARHDIPLHSDSGKPVSKSERVDVYMAEWFALAEMAEDDARLVTLASLHLATPEDLIGGIPDDGLVPANIDDLFAYLIQANS